MEIGLTYFLFSFVCVCMHDFFWSVHERKLGGCVGLIIYYFVYEDETNNNNNNDSIIKSERLVTFKA